MIMKDVVISITGVQQGQNGPQAIELVTQGQYGVERDKICFSYQETELTGMDGTQTIFTVQPKRVELERKGGVNAQMVFQEGLSTSSSTKPPLGLPPWVSTPIVSSAASTNTEATCRSTTPSTWKTRWWAATASIFFSRKLKKVI